MISDFLIESKEQLYERLKNPILGAFTITWLVWNWRPISIYMFSEETIEEKISLINTSYINILDTFIIPLAVSIIFVALMPWVNFLIEKLHVNAISMRRLSWLQRNTDFLKASVSNAEAQASLNNILATAKITKNQQDEIDFLKSELTSQQNKAKESIEELAQELEQKTKEYESRSHKTAEEAAREKAHIELLKEQLTSEKEKASIEAKKVRLELEKKQDEIERKLKALDNKIFVLLDPDFKKILTTNKYELFYNPSLSSHPSKPISFNSDGAIGLGKNKNESKWRIENGLLEILNEKGEVHSRFYYLPESSMFINDNDKATPSKYGQYIITRK